jgi:large subunit ribosomal protein L25
MRTSAVLKAQPRDATGKNVNRKMRATGRVPAVVYGHGEDTRMLSVDAHELDLLFKRVHWENTIIDIEVEGVKAPVRTLVREVQRHAHRPFIFHVDFQQIHAGETLHVEVPIHIVGTAPGVKNGGVLMQVITDLQIRCTPDNIPEYIEVDISGLGINDAIHLSDLKLPAGVIAEVDANATICSVTPPSTGAPTAAAAETIAEPEVITRKKED